MKKIIVVITALILISAPSFSQTFGISGSALAAFNSTEFKDESGFNVTADIHLLSFLMLSLSYNDFDVTLTTIPDPAPSFHGPLSVTQTEAALSFFGDLTPIAPYAGLGVSYCEYDRQIGESTQEDLNAIGADRAEETIDAHLAPFLKVGFQLQLHSRFYFMSEIKAYYISMQYKRQLIYPQGIDNPPPLNKTQSTIYPITLIGLGVRL